MSEIMSDNINMKKYNGRNAIFLDRDGTIIEDVGYINNPDDIRFSYGAIEGLKALYKAGFALIVISNQSGLARGIITEQQFQSVHNRFVELLRENEIVLTDCFYCPYYKNGVVKKYCMDSRDRKPYPGMIIKAARKHNIVLENSFMIGDKEDDIRAGQSAGVKTIKIGNSPDEKTFVNPDFFADNLAEAAKIILSTVRVFEKD